MWVFDDDRVGLEKEPFVGGADTMIDTAIAINGIKNADEGFLLVFSSHPFPDAHFCVGWVREEMGGNVHVGEFEVDGESKQIEGWLCPALNLYYPDAPEQLHVQVRATS